jgi:hypothetical protein
MIDTVKRKVDILRLTSIPVLQTDIDDALCRRASHCMVKVAVERHLRKKYNEYQHYTRVRVDAGHITFCLGGFRWSGDTPKTAKDALIKWDAEEKARKNAAKNNLPFKSKVVPFIFSFMAMRGTKIIKSDPARRAQINAARKKRIAAGLEKAPRRLTLRERIVGFR